MAGAGSAAVPSPGFERSRSIRKLSGGWLSYLLLGGSSKSVRKLASACCSFGASRIWAKPSKKSEGLLPDACTGPTNSSRK